MRFWKLSLAAVVALSFGAMADAGYIVYNNINAPVTDYLPIEPLGQLAASFSTTAAGKLSDLKLSLQLDSPATGGSFTIGLYSNDSSTKPGTLLTTIATVLDSTLSSSPQTYSFSVNYALAENTRYWIQASGVNTNAGWNWTNSTTGIGITGEYQFLGNTTYGNSGGSYGPLLMQVLVEPVPEPSSFALLGLGGMALAFRFVRRQAASFRPLEMPKDLVSP